MTYNDILLAICDLLKSANIGLVDNQEGGDFTLAWSQDNSLCSWTVKFISDNIESSTLSHDEVRFDWSIKGYLPFNYENNSEKYFLEMIWNVKNILRTNLNCLFQSIKVIENSYIDYGDGDGLVLCHFADIRLSTVMYIENRKEN